ncbi:hypothetical protein [Chitiniphilus shinanonensis]|uniref:hypothetical protein n=1 Tax=Chitiniphilus shinanonensis TaxID=553088 RepID=UPI00302923B5
MRYLVLTTLAVSVLSACASIHDMDKSATHFEPTPGGFRYQAFSDLLRPEGSEAGEAVRMRWLNEYLASNNICPSGYEISDRKVVVRDVIAGEKIADIVYYGTCK